MTVSEWVVSGWALAYVFGFAIIVIGYSLPRWRRTYWQWRNKKERARIARMIRRINELDNEKGSGNR